MYRLVSPARSSLALCAGVVIAACSYAVSIRAAATPVEQAAAVHGAVASDPDVLGAERLFSAWMEGQIAYRGLPGIAVGVVSDQELVWARGFGFADVDAKDADDADDEVPHGVAQQAVHSHRDHAAARGRQAAARRSGRRSTSRGSRPSPRETTMARSRSSSCSRTARGCSAKPAITGPRSNSRRRTRSAASTRTGRPHSRRRCDGSTRTWRTPSSGMIVEQVSGERVGRLRRSQHLQAAGHARVERGQQRPRARRAVRPPHARRQPRNAPVRRRARDGRSDGRDVDSSRTWRSSFRRSSARGRGAATQVVSTASMREMHRVRSVEENWTSGTAPRFRRQPHQGPDVGRPRRRVSGQHDADAHSARRQGRRHRPHEHERLEPVRDRAAGDHHGRTSRGQSGGVEARDQHGIPTWARFAGLYRGRGGDSQVVLLNQKLVIITPNAPNVDNPITLEPLGEGRFRFIAPTGGGAVGEVVRFVEETGRPARMYIGDGWIDRVQ